MDVTRLANEGLTIVVEKQRSGFSHEVLHTTDQLLDTLENPSTQKSRARSRKSA